MKTLNLLFLYTSILPFIFGCKKFVTISPPETELVTSNVFANSSTATSAVTVIYSKMINEDAVTLSIPFLTGLSGDELTYHSNNSDIIAFYTNSLTAQGGAATSPYYSIWTPAYSYIYQANAVIEGLTGNRAITASVQRQLLGEALFLRAFWHFYLVNLFGDIPIVLSTNYSLNSSLARSSKADVFAQIITDLKAAKAFLNKQFIDASDTSVTQERTRPTYWAATSLLSRVYLFDSNWLEAKANADTVIENSVQFQLLDNLDQVFLKNSQEAIFQIQPVIDGVNTPEGAAFVLTLPPAGDAYINQSSTISPQLLNAFDFNDRRRLNWIGNVDSFYFPYKYKADAAANGTVEYEMVLRLAEQYLIRAEAKARLNDLDENSGAVADVNAIRKRAGLSTYNGSFSQFSIVDEIYRQRQLELFSEWGHRWMDLKRSGQIDFIMSSVSPLKGGTWSPNWALYPIPQTERLNDMKLTQNPGY